MSICCLWKGEVTFFPFILKMAASSADESRDRGKHADWQIIHNLNFVLLLSQEIQNVISLLSQLGKLLPIVASTYITHTIWDISPVNIMLY